MPPAAHPVDVDGVARAREAAPTGDEAQHLSAVLLALADPLRARIVAVLPAVGELCVGDLALALGAGEDAVSYALRVLRAAGLVESRRQGRMRYYRVPVAGLARWLDGVPIARGERP